MEGQHRVFNLEVYQEHNFLVSESEVLVHNNSAALPKISVVTDDWITKGAHIHVGKVELAVRPNHLGSYTFTKVFSTTSDEAFNAAAKHAKRAFENQAWVNKFTKRVIGARKYAQGYEGKLSPLAKGRGGEFHFLLKALRR